MDEYFLSLALRTARRSADPATKVGAVLVSSAGKIQALGFNRFPVQLRCTPERLNNREEKLKRTIHAEVAAINSALRDFKDNLSGSTLFLAATDDTGLIWGGPPCMACALQIIEHGISNVVSLPGKPAHIPWKWRDNVAEAKEMLDEAGVNFRTVENFFPDSVKTPCE